MRFKKILTIGISLSDLDPEFWKKLDDLCDERVTLQENDSKVSSELAEVDCLLVKFNGASEAIMELAPNLKYVGALATGYGKIDIEYASQKSIVVTNVPGYSTESVAEFIIATILERIRQLATGLASVKNGNYSEVGFKAAEIKGKNFGVVGLGQIGNRVAELAQGFGANVQYWSHEKKNVPFTHKELDDLLASSDFISINLALNQDTQGILNATKLAAIKNGALIVNTAPMELLDFAALEPRLQKGDITFITDHSDEMEPEDVKRLQKYETCVLYPPIGYISEEAKIAKQEIFIGNMKAFLEGSPANRVNS